MTGFPLHVSKIENKRWFLHFKKKSIITQSWTKVGF